MKISAFCILLVVLAGCSKPQHVSVPSFSEQDVREFVTPGRTVAEITNHFGVPGAVMTNDGRVVMWFSNPFEQISKPTASPFAFSASFTNGMVEKWEV